MWIVYSSQTDEKDIEMRIAEIHDRFYLYKYNVSKQQIEFPGGYDAETERNVRRIADKYHSINEAILTLV